MRMLRPALLGTEKKKRHKGLLRSSCRRAGCFTATALLMGSLAMSAQERLGAENAALQQTVQQTLRTGSINGLVTDAEGVPIVGARVTASPVSGAVAAHDLTSDADGRFVLSGLLAGSWTLEVSFEGFDTARSTVLVQAGQSVAIGALRLKLSTINIEVDAVVSTHELAEEQLHEEEQQRLLGFAPNFFVSYKWDAAPLTSGQKFRLAWTNVRDPGNLLLVGTVAGFQQATDEFNGYGQGAAGFGRRYGADLGNLVAGTFMGGAVLPSLFHQDPRYFYKGTGSFKSRFWYAVTSAVICRGDNGRRQFAWAGVLGDLSAGAISNTYYAPEDRHGVALTLENGFLGVAGDALNGVVQEFFFKQITPKAKKPNPKRSHAP